MFFGTHLLTLRRGFSRDLKRRICFVLLCRYYRAKKESIVVIRRLDSVKKDLDTAAGRNVKDLRFTVPVCNGCLA